MLIAMAVYDTEQNERSRMTRETLLSLSQTVDFDRHRLIISDNGSCAKTFELYESAQGNGWSQFAWLPFKVLYNGRNLGTAKAVNRAWLNRRPGEHAVKMDNDVVFHQAGWADWMEDAFSRDPKLGILGLKRNDLDENPFDGTSTLKMLPHTKGQRWITIEEVENVIGTCQGYNSILLDRIGYLNQPGLYGFDDSLASVRARVAGFTRAFLCGFQIDHIDPGGSEHGKWKIEQANKTFDTYKVLACEYEMCIKDVYYAD